MPVPGGESFAQSGNGRTAGYHGNVMVTDHLGVFVGLETSHGYMFDKHNWLGGGINVFVFPDTNLPTYMNVFVDYHNYLKERSSLVLGMKAGWSHAFNYDNGGVNYKNGIFFRARRRLELAVELGKRAQHRAWRHNDRPCRREKHLKEDPASAEDIFRI